MRKGSPIVHSQIATATWRPSHNQSKDLSRPRFITAINLVIAPRDSNKPICISNVEYGALRAKSSSLPTFRTLKLLMKWIRELGGNEAMSNEGKFETLGVIVFNYFQLSNVDFVNSPSTSDFSSIWNFKSNYLSNSTCLLIIFALVTSLV